MSCKTDGLQQTKLNNIPRGLRKNNLGEEKKKKTQKTKISLFIPAFLRVAADYREHLVNEMVLNSVPKWRALKLKSTQRKNHMN